MGDCKQQFLFRFGSSREKRKARLIPPIPWFGGKTTRLSKLLPLIPEHTYYCEVFGGSGALLFAKEPAKFEVYNDIDKSLYNFYKVLQDKEKFEEFYRKVYLTPYHRAFFEEYRDIFDEVEDEVERAYRFFIVIKMSFSGELGGGFAHAITTIRRNMPINVSSYLSVIERLPEIHLRLMTVQIECLDWRDCVRKYNEWGLEGFFYLDPPYLPETRRAGKYKHEMTREDHEELIDWLLSEVRVKVMLNGYDNELYQKLEKYGWKKKCWETSCSAAGKTRLTGILGEGATFKKNQRRVECIWVNYDII